MGADAPISLNFTSQNLESCFVFIKIFLDLSISKYFYKNSSRSIDLELFFRNWSHLNIEIAISYRICFWDIAVSIKYRCSYLWPPIISTFDHLGIHVPRCRYNFDISKEKDSMKRYFNDTKTIPPIAVPFPAILPCKILTLKFTANFYWMIVTT